MGGAPRRRWLGAVSPSSSVKVTTAAHMSSIIWQLCTSPPPFTFLEKWKPSLSSRLSGSIWGRSETRTQRGETTESTCRTGGAVSLLVEVSGSGSLGQVLVPPPAWGPPAGRAEPPP